jgi:hypothetical protein
MDPAQAAELQQFEQMAQMAMGNAAVDPAMRAKADEVLGGIGQSLKHMSTIQNVLDNSTDDVAIMAASNSLLRLVTDHWNSFAGASAASPLPQPPPPLPPLPLPPPLPPQQPPPARPSPHHSSLPPSPPPSREQSSSAC